MKYDVGTGVEVFEPGEIWVGLKNRVGGVKILEEEDLVSLGVFGPGAEAIDGTGELGGPI